jgi:hypothetical protein
MVEGPKRRVESIKQQVKDIARNVRDRFKEKVSAKVRNALPISFLLLMGMIVVFYIIIAEMGNTVFYKTVKL